MSNKFKQKPVGYATVTIDDDGFMDICCIQPKEKHLSEYGCICSSHPECYVKVALMPLAIRAPKKLKGKRKKA